MLTLHGRAIITFTDGIQRNEFFCSSYTAEEGEARIGGQSSLISDPLLLPHHYHVKNEGTANINVPMNHLGILL